MKNNNPKISIIIVTYNNENWVDQCLSSLLNQTYTNFETIFVDNASKDRSVEIAKENKFKSLDIKFIQRVENGGFSVGNNVGVEISSGEIIFLLNSDARIEKDTLEKVIHTFSNHPNTGIIQNKTLLMMEPDKLDSAGSLFTKTGFLKHIGRTEAIKEDKEYPIFAGKGASLFIRKEVIDKTYLFDSKFHSYFEDTDVCWRSWIMGMEVIYSPEGISYHKGGDTGLKMTSGFTDYHSFKNRIRCLITHLEIKNILYILPIHILICLLISFTYLLRGRFTKSKAIFKAIFWNIKEIPNTLKVRKLIQSKRIMTDKQIFNLVSSKFDLIYSLKSLFNYTGW